MVIAEGTLSSSVYIPEGHVARESCRQLVDYTMFFWESRHLCQSQIRHHVKLTQKIPTPKYVSLKWHHLGCHVTEIYCAVSMTP